MYDNTPEAEKASTGETAQTATNDFSDQRAVADGGATWRDLTGFQRDALEAIQRLEHGGETPYGIAIREELAVMRGEDVNHGRLYPNLDAGFVGKGELDRRTNSYDLTPSDRAMVRERVQRLASAFNVENVVADGGESA